MGMVMELYSVDPHLLNSGENVQPEADNIRQIGTLVGSVSINSVAVSETCQWMLRSPLAQLAQVETGGSTTLLVQPHDIPAIIEQINNGESPTALAVTNALSDAAEEAVWREQVLGIVMS